MKIYVYDNVDVVSMEYHCGGGLVIVTGREPQQVWSEYVRAQIEETTWGGPFGTLEDPADRLPYPASAIYEDYTIDRERIFVFPDAGCC